MTEPVLLPSADECAVVQDILRKHVPAREVWAFGSRISRKAWRYADLDLAIISDTPLSFGDHAALVDEFSESDLPFRVDILEWARTDDVIRRIVRAAKVVIQDRPAGHSPGVA
jgi:predicted nucleotidyltransferase